MTIVMIILNMMTAIMVIIVTVWQCAIKVVVAIVMTVINVMTIVMAFVASSHDYSHGDLTSTRIAMTIVVVVIVATV